MAKTGLQNEQIISELLVSGSQIIDTKNNFGVYQFDSSNTEDGIVSEKLVKPKYDNVELQKAIDTNIVELLPGEITTPDETVPKYLYDAKQVEVDLLVLENEDLSSIINSLEGRITELEIDLENMRIDMDNKDLLLAQAENQSQQSNSKVGTSITELQNAIQRATAESVERTSLLAKNESLQSQILTYEKQLENANKQLESAQNQIVNQNQTINDLNVRVAQATNTANVAQSDLLSQTKKKKIICDLLYRQGFIPENIWAADEAFGSMMLQTNKPVAMGYLIWAKDVVKYFTKNPQYSKYLYILVKPWSEHMAHMMGVLPNDNLIGKGLHFMGCQYSKLVYNIYKLKRNYNRNKFSLGWQ